MAGSIRGGELYSSQEFGTGLLGLSFVQRLPSAAGGVGGWRKEGTDGVSHHVQGQAGVPVIMFKKITWLNPPAVLRMSSTIVTQQFTSVKREVRALL